ncbi:KpsF/GutQ family sugar-phosphate isomerase [Chromobacterium vaccinii]|uniref:KpsF/GutQ family sugar-phosphate isomerase n=1 Tax=Chromobacterium vaccinii TaxID=1108595 RepID=A0ABV0FBU5_9NEIS
MNKNHTISIAQRVIRDQIDALERMSSLLGDSFLHAIEIIEGTNGRVVVVGMGKSGIIGRKIAATMASTGTTAFFVHPGEAFHGDLGMIKPIDILLMISNSGETEELIRLLPFLQYQKNKIISLTGNINSTLARNSHVILNISVEKEACQNNLAPTCSTTATLVMGDALSITLSSRRGFESEDFARFHPGGRLGRSLLTLVKDIMHTGSLPKCKIDTPFHEVVNTITYGRLGLCIVIDNNEPIGIITDGDIRRSFLKNSNPLQLIASEVMSNNPKTINENYRICEAEKIMLKNGINALIAVNQDGKLSGIIQLKDSII